MKEAQFFIVIYIKDRLLQTILDGIRLFSDPIQKHHAHLTVRGPYRQEKKKKELQSRIEKWNEKIKNERLDFYDIGCFSSPTRDVLYFKCRENDPLNKIWWKKDFHDFNPHVTICNSSDKQFSHRVKEIIEKHSINFSSEKNELEILKSNPSEELKISSLQAIINYGLLSEILNETIQRETVNHLSKEKRLSYIDKLCNELQTFELNHSANHDLRNFPVQ